MSPVQVCVCLAVFSPRWLAPLESLSWYSQPGQGGCSRLVGTVCSTQLGGCNICLQYMSRVGSHPNLQALPFDTLMLLCEMARPCLRAGAQIIHPHSCPLSSIICALPKKSYHHLKVVFEELDIILICACGALERSSLSDKEAARCILQHTKGWHLMGQQA